MERDTYPTPEHGWVCFHCGEEFPGTMEGERAARDHFGPTPDHTPGCLLRLESKERTLLHQLRRLDASLKRYREEDSEKDRQMRSMEADHAVALRRAEETGYARGVRDAQTESRWQERQGEEYGSF